MLAIRGYINILPLVVGVIVVNCKCDVHVFSGDQTGQNRQTETSPVM